MLMYTKSVSLTYILVRQLLCLQNLTFNKTTDVYYCLLIDNKSKQIIFKFNILACLNQLFVDLDSMENKQIRKHKITKKIIIWTRGHKP